MFKFNGKSDKEMQVVCEEELSLVTKAEKANDEKNNDDYYEYGYNKVSLKLKLYVYNKNLDDIYSWLDGKGELEYDGRVTTAFFYKSIAPSRCANIKTIEIEGIRLPFWYKANDIFTKVNTIIKNEGNTSVRPIFRIIKNNDSKIKIKVNDIEFLYSFPEEENEVEFDCNTFNATYKGFYRNENMEIGFEYPSLAPGNNKIEIFNDCTVYVKRKDCWL